MLFSNWSPLLKIKKTKISLVTEERNSTVTSVPNSIQSKCLKFATWCLEINFAHWVKCAYRELKRVLGLLQKIYWCARAGHKQHRFQQNNFLLYVYKSVTNTISEEHPLSMDQDRGNSGMQFFDNIED